MSYILLLDSRDETLHLQDICLSRFYGGKILTRKSSQEAIQVMERNGPPELIVADHSLMKNDELHGYISQSNLPIPLFVSADQAQHDEVWRFFPNVTAVLDRPLSTDVLDQLVKSVSSIPGRRPTHIPVLISTLLIFGQQKHELYLKLSDTNYVKVLNAGESFSESDAIRFYTKGITHLHLAYNDGTLFMQDFERSLFGVIQNPASFSGDLAVLTIESMETIEAMAKQMGWTREAITVARRCINMALGVISKDESLIRTLKRRLSTPSSPYRRHVGLLAYLTCLMASSYGQDSESTQMKLALAALLHDLSVDDRIYEDVRVWNRKAADQREKSAETVKYRMHPLESAKTVHSLKTLPPDVEQIILQHHERPDGSGFPRGLTASRIPLLTSMFILTEELVEFIDDGERLETSLKDFMTWGREFYQDGHCKKIFEMMEMRLKDLN
jgi:CheY-like chemotaxis protein